VFTARYALSPYIKQIRFVFKGLNMITDTAHVTALSKNYTVQGNANALQLPSGDIRKYKFTRECSLQEIKGWGGGGGG
jgi:hypothetical protein